MNRTELLKKIKELGVPASFYSLEGCLIYGTVLDPMIEPGWYRVFEHDERGGFSKEEKFNSEEKACDYAYKLISITAGMLSDDTRNKWRDKYAKEGEM